MFTPTQIGIVGYLTGCAPVYHKSGVGNLFSKLAKFKSWRAKNQLIKDLAARLTKSLF
jgi:hypothetical protein